MNLNLICPFFQPIPSKFWICHTWKAHSGMGVKKGRMHLFSYECWHEVEIRRNIEAHLDDKINQRKDDSRARSIVLNSIRGKVEHDMISDLYLYDCSMAINNTKVKQQCGGLV